MAFKMKGPSLLKMVSALKNKTDKNTATKIATPMDKELDESGVDLRLKNPKGPVENSVAKDKIPPSVEEATKTNYKESKSKGTQNVKTNATNLNKLNDIEDKISFIKEDLFNERITKKEANKKIKELEKNAEFFRNKHVQSQEKYSDLEKYDDDRG